MNAEERGALAEAFGVAADSPIVAALEECLRRHRHGLTSNRRYWTARRRREWAEVWSAPPQCPRCRGLLSDCRACQALAARCREELDAPPWRRRGRPPGPAPASRLACEVAWLLTSWGFRLTAERRGLLSTVLAILFGACGVNVADMRDPAALAVEAVTRAENDWVSCFNVWTQGLLEGGPAGAEMDILRPVPGGRRALIEAAHALQRRDRIEALFALVRAFAEAESPESQLVLEIATAEAAEARVRREPVPEIRLRPLP